jgi:hypothetical protein
MDKNLTQSPSSCKLTDLTFTVTDVGVSANEYSCTREPKLTFGNLTLCFTYDINPLELANSVVCCGKLPRLCRRTANDNL